MIRHSLSDQNLASFSPLTLIVTPIRHGDLPVASLGLEPVWRFMHLVLQLAEMEWAKVP